MTHGIDAWLLTENERAALAEARRAKKRSEDENFANLMAVTCRVHGVEVEAEDFLPPQEETAEQRAQSQAQFGAVLGALLKNGNTL